jgi:hypothetical protein
MVVGESEAGDSVRFLARGEVAGRVDLEASADGPGLLGGAQDRVGVAAATPAILPAQEVEPAPAGVVHKLQWTTRAS